jgi:hypothetical protein
MSLSLVEIRPTPPDPKPTSYRFWERYRLEQLIAIRGHIETVIDDMSRQFGLFDPPAIAPEDPTVPPAAPDAKQNALGAMLSPSQVKTFLDCSARWWFKYGAGLIDPAGGSLVRGRVVHKMCERFMRAKLDGAPISADDLAEPFEEAWDRESNLASFHNDDDVELLKRQAAVLSRKWIDEVAPEIQPAALELPVTGSIAGVPVRGIIDLLDVDGRIVDLKTAARKPAGIDPGYAFQLATYRQLEPRSNGKVRLDTLVATKTPQLVTIDYTVSVADQMLTQSLYPHVREGIREGLYYPNRCSNLCSRKLCNFADACEHEYGGTVKGAADE